MREFEKGTRCYVKLENKQYYKCKVIERSTSTAMVEILGGPLDGYREAVYVHNLKRYPSKV